MAEKAITTCTVKKGFVKPCDSLKRSIDGKIIREQVIWDNMATLPKGTIITLHSGTTLKRRINGVVLNYCPFCAGKLHKPNIKNKA